MVITLAFDIYGTIIDTHGVVAALENIVGEKAASFSQAWREKQLEYSFRRGLMRRYEDFAVCTRDALGYTAAYYKTSLTGEQEKELLTIYRILPPFKDVEESLIELQAAGFRIFAFSNGRRDAVEMLLENGGIKNMFRGIVSVDDLKSFKPNPDVYRHFLNKSGSTVGESAWMISGNPFDVIGAISAGMKAAWVKRSLDAIFDPWGIEPTITVNTLVDLCERITEHG